MKFNNKNSLVSKTNLENYDKKISVYVEQMQEVARKNTYDYDESSINCPFEKNIIPKILELKEKKHAKELKYIFVIGIGGSNLGTKAVYDAIFGHFDEIEPDRFPKMIFLDTNNPSYLEKTQTFINKNISSPKEILLCVISKSGGTMETIANAEIAINILEKKFKNILERLVVITDYQSKMWQIAKEKNIDHLTIPQKIGGRFSVFSAVGLFPLSICGIDIISLLSGAKKMRNLCLKKNSALNPALTSAKIIFENLAKGKTINDYFFFNPELESLGKWHRQLAGESLGKEKNLKGKIVNAGITPTVSIGSADLHSVGQLYFGGPKDKFTTFVKCKNKEKISVPKKLVFTELTKNVAGKKAEEIMLAIFEGVKKSYEKEELPFVEIILDGVNEKSIGEFMQFKMCEIMYLAKLMNINAFDQPNVESYKIETKKNLQK